jgi:nucleoside-diphosphate-sugar epimerase
MGIWAVPPNRGLPTVEIQTPYYSTWLDNAKARFLLGWRAEHDLKKLIEAAWNYQRAPDDPGRYGIG